MSDTVFFLLYLPANYIKNKNKRDWKHSLLATSVMFIETYVDNFLGSNFYGRTTNDSNKPTEDVQKYILATSDFAKGIRADINHYITRDRINNASFRQKLDPISKNIILNKNPLKLVFEYVSTFDTENLIVGLLLREIDLNEKQTDSDFIKSLPSQPGKEFDIKKTSRYVEKYKKPSRKKQ